MSIIEKAANKLKRNLQTNTKNNGIESIITTDKHIDFSDKATLSMSEINAPQHHPTELTTNEITIDLDKLHDLGIVIPKQGNTPVAEQFRIIKRPLLAKVFNEDAKLAKHANLIMVTSSLAGEGKSFCAVNLAMSIASEMDHRVLLIDADVARPSIPEMFNFDPKKGLLDILVKREIDVADILIKTNVDKLTLITAGKRHSHATELLASQAMSSLLDELAQRYPDRIVIFDSPPLLLTSEARVLATQMGQIVVVVEAEKTTQKKVKDTLKQLAFCENINLIYNKSRTFSGSNYYGYGYYE